MDREYNTLLEEEDLLQLPRGQKRGRTPATGPGGALQTESRRKTRRVNSPTGVQRPARSLPPPTGQADLDLHLRIVFALRWGRRPPAVLRAACGPRTFWKASGRCASSTRECRGDPLPTRDARPRNSPESVNNEIFTTFDNVGGLAKWAEWASLSPVRMANGGVGMASLRVRVLAYTPSALP